MSYYKVDGADLTAIANKIRTKGGTAAQLEFPDDFEDAIDAISAFTVSDEGKVVSSGALVAQTSQNIAANGTYDTTLKNEVVVNIPSGAVTVASGTFTGDDNPQIAIPVGKKMPKTDFVFSVWCDDGTEIEYANNTKLLEVMLIANKHFAIYDLSSDGSKDASGQITVESNNSGTITNRTPKGVAATNWTIRNGSLGYGALGNWGSSANCFIIRDSNGFTVRLYGNNTSTFLASGITYKWELVYFGSDPTNDIVEVA